MYVSSKEINHKSKLLPQQKEMVITAPSLSKNKKGYYYKTNKATDKKKKKGLTHIFFTSKHNVV
jgi:hypothetical protein